MPLYTYPPPPSACHSNQDDESEVEHEDDRFDGQQDDVPVAQASSKTLEVMANEERSSHRRLEHRADCYFIAPCLAGSFG